MRPFLLSALPEFQPGMIAAYLLPLFLSRSCSEKLITLKKEANLKHKSSSQEFYMKKQTSKAKTEVVVPPAVVDATLSMMDDDAELMALLDAEEVDTSPAADHEIEGAVADLEIAEELSALHIDAEPDAEIATATPKKVRAPKATSASAAVAKIGDHAFVFSKIEDSLEGADLASLVTVRSAMLDHLPKKVGEKAVNLIQALRSSASISVYTRYAMDMLVKDGEVTAAKLRAAYIARPYTPGTASAQSSQMMRLLPDLGIAKLVGGVLTPRDDSTLLEAYRAARATGKAVDVEEEPGE